MADADAEPNPLLEALPPATDYLTYLTLLEYNLKSEDLPLLNDILQDATLTINIGWDLVFLLVPLLPASEQCLHTIARLGNPREVLLKVTEALRCIEFVSAETEDDAVETADASNATPRPQGTQQSKAAKPDLPVIHFKVLLSMLSVLHLRIKTKYPSRFIATTVQGVLAAFSNANGQYEDLLEAIRSFVHEVLRSRTPDLAPPDGRNDVSTPADQVQSVDPEAQPEASSQEEHQITRRLLQGFLTHVMEAYIIALSAHDVPGLAWSSRVFEIMQPKKIVRRRVSMQHRFATEQGLSRRASSMAGMSTLAIELGLDFQELINGALAADQSSSKTAEAEEDPPESADDIPLSKIGALFLLASSVFSSVLSSSEGNDLPGLELFPTQLEIAQSFIGTEESGGLNTAGSEPAAVIDAVLVLGLFALYHGSIGEPESDEQFSQYLQIVTLISANSPEPNLRFHAHFLASSLLRAHPSDVYRLAFIRDTLEHCPIENLKASAVSWIKGETLEANMASGDSEKGKPTSVFATPVALETLRPFLFPDVGAILGSSEVVENWTVLKMNLTFYLAVLNFYYLLLSAPQLQDTLHVAALDANNYVGRSMLGPLRQKSNEFRESLKDGDLAQAEGEQGVEGALSDLDLLDDVLERIKHGRVR